MTNKKGQYLSETIKSQCIINPSAFNIKHGLYGLLWLTKYFNITYLDHCFSASSFIFIHIGIILSSSFVCFIVCTKKTSAYPCVIISWTVCQSIHLVPVYVVSLLLLNPGYETFHIIHFTYLSGCHSFMNLEQLVIYSFFTESYEVFAFTWVLLFIILFPLNLK